MRTIHHMMSMNAHRWWLCLLASVIAVLTVQASAIEEVDETVPFSVRTDLPAMVLHLDRAIGPATADYITNGLKKAAERKAPLVILSIDTPGGLDTSMREIIRAILASPVPVASYVAPSGARAASAGTFILYASHIAAMAPGTNTGAATPVQFGTVSSPQDGNQPGKGGDAMERKVINDAVAFIRSLAELRGRNADWAEKAVRDASSISASTALNVGVIDIEAHNLDDLLRQMHRRVVTVYGHRVTLDTTRLVISDYPPDWRTRMLAAITNPSIALLLMLIGVYGLIFEFMSPGSYLPGTLGAICLLAGLYALAALPVNYAGLALIALGIGMLIAEGYTFSHGVLGTGGVVAFALGAAILVDTESPEFRIPWSVITSLSMASGAIVLLTVRTALGTRRRKVVSGAEEMIGTSGIVQDWFGGSGHVFVHGERWSACSELPVRPGHSVRVIRLSELTVEVEPVESEED